ncbi:MAG: hypothetical protein JW838_00320 [Spirochaetes bacterium]|nr:hypothetical protein [Spirochaetota bacterium]
MQREISYDTLESFIAGLRDSRIEKIAFGETNEKRPEQVEPGLLRLVDVERVELVAYRDSVIHKCVLNDVDRDGLYRRLAGEGFEVTRRSRNIT